MINRFFTLFFFVVFMVPVTRGQHKIISNDSIVLIENTLKKVGKNVNFTIIPGPVSGTTEKL